MVDDERGEAEAAALWNLGLGEPYPVSALHGRGSGDLLDAVLEALPEAPAEDFEAPRGPRRVAIVGKPNVGKSSLLNKLAGSDRVVVDDVAGTTVDGRYKLESRPTLTPAVKPGDTRHSVMLEQLAPNVFRWDTRVDLAIGAISADETSNLISLVLRAPEGRTETALREDYRAAFPRATAAFGKGFSIDSLHTAPAAMGASRPSTFAICGARARANSSKRIACSICVAPEPPYSVGHVSPAQPRSLSLRCQSRRNWNEASSPSGSRPG